MLGKWIRKERERRDWSQTDLAKHADLSPAAISQIETGKRARPNPDSIERIARAFRMTVEEMYRAAYSVGEASSVQDSDLQAQWDRLPTWQKRLALLALESTLKLQQAVAETQAEIEELDRQGQQLQRPAE